VKVGPDGLPAHYTTAQKNLELLLRTLETKGWSQGKDGIIIRFGHATHATAEQAQRMAALGIVAEVNLTSNRVTGAMQHRGGPGSDVADHSLVRLLVAGTPTILSTDATPSCTRTSSASTTSPRTSSSATRTA
jgi:predicted amidohydrolase YtcJ